MSKYRFPPERMPEVYDTLDETGGMLMKDSEFQFWVEKIVEEQVSPYRKEVVRQYRQIDALKKEIQDKERHIKRLICTLRVNPEQMVYSFQVSIDILKSKDRDMVIADVVEKLFEIANGPVVIEDAIISCGGQQQMKKGRWKRWCAAFWRT